MRRRIQQKLGDSLNVKIYMVPFNFAIKAHALYIILYKDKVVFKITFDILTMNFQICYFWKVFYIIFFKVLEKKFPFECPFLKIWVGHQIEVQWQLKVSYQIEVRNPENFHIEPLNFCRLTISFLLTFVQSLLTFFEHMCYGTLGSHSQENYLPYRSIASLISKNSEQIL